MNETNWTPGLITLGAGLAAAILFLLTQKKKAAPSEPEGTEGLDAKYQTLLGQLKAHADARHLMSAEAWAGEQTRLEQAAAQVLREKANVSHEALKAEARAQKAAEAPKSFFARNPALAGALWGGAAVAFFVFLGVTLSTESTARVEDGSGPMGGRPGEAAPPQPQMDPRLAAALNQAEREPDNVEALATAAGELIKRQMFEDAEPLVVRATLLDPYHVRTRVYRTVISALRGPPGPALAELERLADTYEDAWQARLYAGALAAQTQQPARALKSFERFLVEAPASEHPPMLRRGIEELRQQVQGDPKP